MTEFDELFLPFKNINKGNMINLDDIFTEEMINKISHLSNISSDTRFKKLLTILSRKFDYSDDAEINQYVLDLMTCIGYPINDVIYEDPSVLQ